MYDALLSVKSSNLRGNAISSSNVGSCMEEAQQKYLRAKSAVLVQYRDAAESCNVSWLQRYLRLFITAAYDVDPDSCSTAFSECDCHALLSCCPESRKEEDELFDVILQVEKKIRSALTGIHKEAADAGDVAAVERLVALWSILKDGVASIGVSGSNYSPSEFGDTDTGSEEDADAPASCVKLALRLYGTTKSEVMRLYHLAVARKDVLWLQQFVRLLVRELRDVHPSICRADRDHAELLDAPVSAFLKFEDRMEKRLVGLERQIRAAHNKAHHEAVEKGDFAVLKRDADIWFTLHKEVILSLGEPKNASKTNAHRRTRGVRRKAVN